VEAARNMLVVMGVIRVIIKEELNDFLRVVVMGI
jgi:hypothetical protein|tara:strand:+ start:55 stop:156 length:102 start_codon:yes stop_codon:yes gene_type:complete